MVDIRQGRTGIGAVAVNLDHSINHGIAEKLKSDPEAYAQHAAFGFCGWVYYENGQFHDQIWVHHFPMNIKSADSVEEMVELANKEYGYE